MSERTLTLIGGGPGTGKSRLGRELERQNIRHIEHISMGNLVRGIASRAISSCLEAPVIAHLNAHPARPLDSELAYDLAYEAFERTDMQTHILLDGFPRYPDQVEQTYELAGVTQRRLTGMIETTASDSVALRRLIGRDDRTITIEEAQRRLQHFKDSFPIVRSTLVAREMDLYTIDTNGSKDITDQMAASALRELMQQEPAIA